MSTQQLDPTGAWNRIATGYDEFVTPTHLEVSNEGIARSGLRRGDRFLDVAAGTGALSIPAARLGAEVVATDIAPVMVERLQARAEAEGLDNVTGRVMDGHALDFEDDTFDVAGSQFGVMLFPDLPRALGEMARVVKPGGRVLVTAFGSPAEIEFLGFFLGAMKAAIPGFTGLPTDPPPPEFQIAHPAKLQAALADAGLKDVQVESTTETLEFGSADEMWNWVTNSNPIGASLVAGLNDDQSSEVRGVLEGMLRERAQGNGVAVLTNPVNIGIGVK
ncbi:MAG: class I SAM-dependent methyltransferase [Actinomycetota bacterium]